jgi:Tol biopolymer transport system component
MGEGDTLNFMKSLLSQKFKLRLPHFRDLKWGREEGVHMHNLKQLLLLSLFLLTACGPASAATSVPAITDTYRFKPLPATWTAMWMPSLISTPTLLPTNTSTPKNPPTQPTPDLNSSKLTPGIYPVYRQEGKFYIWIDSDPKDLVPLGITTDDNNAIPSPDGHLIAYMSDGFIYTKNIVSGEEVQIPQPNEGSFDKFWQGSWSPDGKYLAYAMSAVNSDGTTLNIEEMPSIYIANLSENTYAKVTSWETFETNPIWSPDGEWIAFLSDHAKVYSGAIGNFIGSTDIYIMSTNCLPNLESCKDQPKKQLTPLGIKGDAVRPSWNPNGRRIGFVFVDGATGDRDIYAVGLNGTIVNLTNTPESIEDTFSWSGDGNRIVFEKLNYELGNDLYTMDITTQTETPITNSPNKSEGAPYWSPDNNSIAYISDVDSTNNILQIFSIKNKAPLDIDGSDKEFLFWLTFFPEMQSGAMLQVSPSGNEVNLRQGPSIADTSIAKLKAGDILNLVDTVTNGKNEIWWNISTNNLNGWVRQIYNWYLPVGNHPFSP